MVALAVAVGVLLATQAEDARDRARDAFTQGQELYRAGDYAGALAAFQNAETARASPAAEYNIGRCYERLGQPAESVAAYERYLQEAPDAPDHDAVAEHVSELRRQIALEGHFDRLGGAAGCHGHRGPGSERAGSREQAASGRPPHRPRGARRPHTRTP